MAKLEGFWFDARWADKLANRYRVGTFEKAVAAIVRYSLYGLLPTDPLLVDILSDIFAEISAKRRGMALSARKHIKKEDLA